jgi:hypothetical protein
VLKRLLFFAYGVAAYLIFLATPTARSRTGIPACHVTNSPRQLRSRRRQFREARTSSRHLAPLRPPAECRSVNERVATRAIVGKVSSHLWPPQACQVFR